MDLKKTLFLLLGFILLLAVYLGREPLAKFITLHLMTEKRESDVLESNSYARDYDFLYVQRTNDFEPNEQKDLINIFYTVLNSGMNEFTFYCAEEYTNCISDIDYISNNQMLLSNINGFVAPYNNFKDLETVRYDTTGKIVFRIQPVYSDEMIDALEQKVDQVLQEVTNDTMTQEDKIKAIHDYIIENTKYDSARSDEQISEYQSTTAYGPLIEGYGVCSGYSDAMMLFLDRLGIPNFKISSENHIWNLVYLNDTWLHLDLTWDDPVLDNGNEIIDYEYFLITTEELFEKDDQQHFFDEEIFLEATQNIEE